MTTNRPPVTTVEDWQTARDALLVEEKQLTRALDALAAKRRRLPMHPVRADHRLTAPDGAEVTLADAFDGRRQLVVYHFMLSDDSDHVCGGCGSFTDNIGRQDHLNQRDTTLVLMSPGSQERITPVRERFGWTTPWYSAHGSGLYDELGLGGGFALTVFLRDGDEVFRTYSTTSRGVDRLRLDFNLMDLTPYGRQEEWEDSPEGWPQTPTWARLDLRDLY